MIKNFVIGVAIFILTIAVGIYGINAIYGPEPQYDKYCPSLITQQECLNFGANWTTYPNVNEPGKPLGSDGYCDVYSACKDPLEAAQKVHERNVFFIALPLGVIVIALGALVFGLESVGAGLMAGGVGIIIYGVGGFWRFADDWLKFAISLVGLVLVIWLAYYFNKKWQAKGSMKVHSKKKKR